MMGRINGIDIHPKVSEKRWFLRSAFRVPEGQLPEGAKLPFLPFMKARTIRLR